MNFNNSNENKFSNSIKEMMIDNFFRQIDVEFWKEKKYEKNVPLA